ncbi:hypothetical protein BGZ46_003807, partial [Entomortierella lignicola]
MSSEKTLYLQQQEQQQEQQQQPKETSPVGCLDIIKCIIFGSSANAASSNAKEHTFSEKDFQAYHEMIKSSNDNNNGSEKSLPPAYEALRQEMSQLHVNGSDIKLSDLWETDEFAKTVHHAIESVSAEL